jgi:hypothetical protein
MDMYEESVATIFQLDTDYPYKGCIGKGWLKTLQENDPHKQGNNIISRTMHGFHAIDTTNNNIAFCLSKLG